MEINVTDKARNIIFFAAAVMMYYFLTQEINLGIFITYRHAFALVLILIAIIDFLRKPNIVRGCVAAKDALVFSLPMLVTFSVSLFIWFANQVDTTVISRGLSSMFFYTNMFSFTLAAAAFLYFFGERGIWYNLIAILTANLLMIATIISKNGLAPYFSEFITLIKTFAGETGDIIVQAEVHELAFCIGAYLIYMLLKPQKNKTFFVILALSAFCFLSAFKRIGIIAIAVTLVLGWLLKFTARFSKKAASGVITLITLLVIFSLLAYIYAIKMNAFEFLEQLGINTSGRAGIYAAVDKYYEFSPAFLGNGIGALTYHLNTDLTAGVSAVHNDFLQYYIDLGFWGYILWLVSITLVRTLYFGRDGKTENAITAFSLILYLIIVSLTDNTMNYPLLTTTTALLMIGGGFNERVRNTEYKIFGHISAANKKAKGEIFS